MIRSKKKNHNVDLERLHEAQERSNRKINHEGSFSKQVYRLSNIVNSIGKVPNIKFRCHIFE